MFSMWSSRGAALPKQINSDSILPSSTGLTEIRSSTGLEPVIDRSRPVMVRCRHGVGIACNHCAEQATSEAERQDLEPDLLEPAEHAQMVIRYFQEHRLFGFRLATEIANFYPLIAEEANVIEIPVNQVLNELFKVTKKGRRKKIRDGKIQHRRAYWIPKPRAAKVVAIDRRAS
jgi:hypothetical protein